MLMNSGTWRNLTYESSFTVTVILGVGYEGD